MSESDLRGKDQGARDGESRFELTFDVCVFRSLNV